MKEISYQKNYFTSFPPKPPRLWVPPIFADYYSHLIVTEESYEELEAPLDPLDEENTQER